MSAQPPPNDPLAFEGLAAIAITAAEMGATDEELVAAVGSMMLRLGMGTPDEVRAVAVAIGRLPQPLDEGAYERERRRPIEEMLGVTSPEDQLAASLRARAALEAFASRMEAQE